MRFISRATVVAMHSHGIAGLDGGVEDSDWYSVEDCSVVVMVLGNFERWR